MRFDRVVLLILLAFCSCSSDVETAFVNVPCSSDDACDDGNDCTTETCDGRFCTYIAHENGTICKAEGQIGVCSYRDGHADCVTP